MKMMKKQHVTTLVLAIGLMASIVVIVAGLDLFASWLHNESEDAYAQSVYDFAVDAKAMHEELEGSSLINDFEALFEAVSRESPPGSTDTELAIIHQQLSAQGYKEGYDWLSPPTVESREVQASLILEGKLFQDCYIRLWVAWLKKNRSGDEFAYAENLEKARELFEEAISLRAKNKVDLDILLVTAKQYLEQ